MSKHRPSGTRIAEPLDDRNAPETTIRSFFDQSDFWPLRANKPLSPVGTNDICQ
jgi:hypothetical protein